MLSIQVNEVIISKINYILCKTKNDPIWTNIDPSIAYT